MPTRKPKAAYPNTAGGRGATSVAALRRRAEAYRAKADALESTLQDTQEQFAESFSAADAQVSTRDRISEAAREGRRLGARGGR